MLYLYIILTMTNPMNYGYLFIEVDNNIINDLISKVEYNDLYKPEVKNYGLSKNPHLTIIYGILHYVDDNDIRQIIEEISTEPIIINVEGLSTFENDDFDVLKLTVDKSDTIIKLNDSISKLGSHIFFEYNPHITIAFTKKGEAMKYVESITPFKIENITEIKYKSSNKELITFNIK